jgi:ferrochelatase
VSTSISNTTDNDLFWPSSLSQHDQPLQSTYDAILFVSFGGPEGPDDVLPFMRNVTAGRGIPDERLKAVSEHYLHFGGVSPINQQNRELLRALRAELDRRGVTTPIWWGNRNWTPYVDNAVMAMTDAGVQRAVAIATSAYSSYSGCRQYREDVARAQQLAGPTAPAIDKLRQYWNRDGFINPMVDNVLAALQLLPDDQRAEAQLVFTAHSIPMANAESSDYVAQLRSACAMVASRLATKESASEREWQLVYQSRSGAPQTPWLEPDISDHLRTLGASGVRAVCVLPIGFVSDHLEVLWDLDTQAQETAHEIGLTMVRAATVGTTAAFVESIADMLVDALAAGTIELCPQDCCLVKH